MDWNHIGKTIMHFSPAAIALSTTLALVSSAGFAQSEHVPTPQSAALVADGQAAESAGDLEAAFGLYVSALAYDPLNANAYVEMGDVAYAQQLYGSAIRYYSRAIELDPSDPKAIAGQGTAYVAKGAMERAQANLQKLKLKSLKRKQQRQKLRKKKNLRRRQLKKLLLLQMKRAKRLLKKR